VSTACLAGWWEFSIVAANDIVQWLLPWGLSVHSWKPAVTVAAWQAGGMLEAVLGGGKVALGGQVHGWVGTVAYYISLCCT
jgi:hypothetical protein